MEYYMNNNSSATLYRVISAISILLATFFLLSGWIEIEVFGGSHRYTVFELTNAADSFNSLFSYEKLEIASFILKITMVLTLIDNAFALLYAVTPIKKQSPKRLSFLMTDITVVIVIIGMIYVGFEHIHPNINLLFVFVFECIAGISYSKCYRIITADVKHTKAGDQKSRVCPVCGAPINDSQSFCGICGNKL